MLQYSAAERASIIEMIRREQRKTDKQLKATL